MLTLTEAAEHPHLAARSTYVHRDGRLEPCTHAPLLPDPTQLGSPPPLPGADTRETLKRWGMDDVEDSLASGAVREHRDPDDLSEDE